MVFFNKTNSLKKDGAGSQTMTYFGEIKLC